MEDKMNDYVYILDNSEMIFLIIRQMSSGILEEIASQFRVKTKNFSGLSLYL